MNFSAIFGPPLQGLLPSSFPFAPRMTDDGAREPAGVTRVVAVDRAGCARVVGRLHAAHNRSVLGLEQGWLGEVVVMKISISRKVVCSRAGGAQGLWGSCPTSWNPREASQQRILGPRPQAAWGGGGGRGPVGQGGAREPRGQPEAASRVQHGQQTPCRATTAVDRAICAAARWRALLRAGFVLV